MSMPSDRTDAAFRLRPVLVILGAGVASAALIWGAHRVVAKRSQKAEPVEEVSVVPPVINEERSGPMPRGPTEDEVGLAAATVETGLASRTSEPGKLFVSTQPSGARVSVGKLGLKNSPAEFRGLPAESVVLRVEMEDYEPVEQAIQVPADTFFKTNFYLRPRQGWILARTDPSGADVEVDGRPVAATPALLGPFVRGCYAMTLRHPGYRSVNLTADVVPDRTNELAVAVLERALCRWIVAVRSTDPDDDYLERQPATLVVGEQARAGERAAWTTDVACCEDRTLRAEVDGYRPVEYTAILPGGVVTSPLTNWPRFRLGEGETGRIEWVFSPIKASIRVLCEAPGAELYGEGRRLGAAGETVYLRPLVPHELIVQAPGFMAVTQRLEAPPPGAVLPERAVALDRPPPPASGKDWRVPGVEMDMAWIPEMDGWVGRYEVANEAFRRFRPNHQGGVYSGYSLDGDRQPVVNVSYLDAQAFLAWLNDRERALGRLPEGFIYRLPTGDEWSRLAECGDLRVFPWGEAPTPPPGWNYHGPEVTVRRPDDPVSDFPPVSWSVERTAPNDWGLHGVGGNVWEWTSEQVGSAYALRGASWLYRDPDNLRIDKRLPNPPSIAYRDFGFRVMLAPPPSPPAPTPPPEKKKGWWLFPNL